MNGSCAASRTVKLLPYFRLALSGKPVGRDHQPNVCIGLGIRDREAAVISVSRPQPKASVNRTVHGDGAIAATASAKAVARANRGPVARS